MPGKPEQLSYELRIGVTGHRNLKEEPAVAIAVDNLIAYLDNLMGRQDNVPIEWTVISPLAKGADRIVAKSILKKESARLEVVIPFPLDEYRKDFTDPEDLQEFNQLLDRAALHIQLPTTSDGYLPAGKKVVDACEILIAIWDGKPSRGKGGTSEIVTYALEQGRTILRIDAENPHAPVTLLRAIKHKGVQKSTPDYEELPLTNETGNLTKNYLQFAEFTRDQHFIDFCHDLYHPDNNQDTLTKKERIKIRGLAKKKALPDAQLEPVLKYFIPAYVRADQLAQHNQFWHEWVSILIHVLSAFAVSVVVFQVIFFEHLSKIILIEIGAMSAVLAALYFSQKYCWHEKWIDYRFLAERLRTAMFTIMVQDYPFSGQSQESQPLPFYNKPKNWIDFLVAIQSKKVFTNINRPGLKAVKTFVVDGWLEGQKKWHLENADKKKNAEHRLHTAVIILFCVTLLMAILHLLESEPNNIAESCKILSFGEWGKFLAITLPAWGAALHAISKQMEYDRIAERSKKMAGELSRLATLANDSNDLDELREIVQQALWTVNLENYEWWALISFNPPELVA
ncbi:MAG: hypothetical protein WCK85_12085 [Chlorobium sp.]